ncbi:MAG TPA: DnaJ family domain-containing protein [Nitrococcus sp.]|nr:DnaJ family domain-containing protein [Nitrococcus sp.]
MTTFDLIAEQRIAEAIERGELSNLPGAGKPLKLDDDALVPPELRLAYRILKNAGFVPPEVEQLRELHELRQLISTLEDDGVRRRAVLRLNLLMAQTTAGRRHGSLRIENEYFEKVAGRLTGS